MELKCLKNVRLEAQLKRILHTGRGEKIMYLEQVKKTVTDRWNYKCKVQRIRRNAINNGEKDVN
jgi:hypothetical protein